jgi:uncharacterized protein (TIGR01777 family)
MKVAITGASGMIGSRLANLLVERGHEVYPVTRDRPQAGESQDPGERRLWWDPARGEIADDMFQGIDAVVHLAGEPIGEVRWTPEVKNAIRSSRVYGTGLLAEHLAQMEQPPQVLLVGSAIGYYGNRGNEALDEESPAGTGFLADLVQAWEGAAAPAADAGIRTVFGRTGIVLDPEAGALHKMLLPFRLGLGGSAGTGDQYMSWITLKDEVAALAVCIETTTLSGPVNLTAPNPATNREFSKTLAKVLHRPCTRIPLIGPRLLYGRELADALLVEGQRVQPLALLAAGFGFSDPVLEPALRRLLNA